jgi:NarL family two-component system sensor histidine kinase YdfH
MQPKLISSLKVEQDYRIFFIFMTLVLAGISILTLVQTPALHQFWLAAIFIILVAIHILLHWLVVRIVESPSRQTWYILGQGLLAFVITQISGNTGMIFSFYMALIGETIGFLGITRWGLLSTVYFLGLSMVNFVLFTDSNLSTAIFWIITAIPLVLFIGMYVTLYLRQSEAREKAQALAAELEAANRQLSEYAARVEDLTIAAERQRMARELHDTLSQGLAGLILKLEAVDANLSHNRSEKAHAIISDAMLQARATLADARRAIDDLRQTTQDDFETSLRLEISRFTDATGIPCVFHADSTPPLPDPVKETIIRAVAEGLTNTARHARATEASVNIVATPTGIEVCIKDDGAGFDPGNIPSGHYGLIGLRERVRLVGGQLSIESISQKGTILTIQIPIS